jgi:riboflavin synthase alpha subunit
MVPRLGSKVQDPGLKIPGVPVFTGLVQKVGRVTRADRKGRDLFLEVSAPSFFGRVRKGDSVAVNGCCLTAVGASSSKASFQAVPETLRLTNLASLARGAKVNLELALRASDRLGGHLLQGHVDGTAEVLSSVKEGAGRRLSVKVPSKWAPYIAPKGSLALDGVSLTVAKVARDRVEVALIPQTLKRTILGTRRTGDRVNLETDILAKQVARFVGRVRRRRKWEVARGEAY